MKRATIFLLSMLLAAPTVVMAQDMDDDALEEDTTQVRRAIRKPKKTEPTRQITGRVVSQQNHAALEGVLVKSIAGEGYSALTDSLGAFTLQVPLYSNAIEVTLPGYNRVRVGLNESGTLRDIILHSDVAPALYGDGDNIMGHVRTQEITYSNALNVATEIQKQLGADVRVTERSGISAGGSYMQIGGVNSLNRNAQPLVVIDGVITDMQYGREMLHSGFFSDVLSNINVNDIESVEVMKNGTAIYGAKGANGVILIKTKRNTSMATRIDATANVGIELMPRLPEMMNGSQYKTYASALLQSTGTTSQSFKFLNNAYWAPKYANNTDWADELYRTAVTQNYGLSVQGGGEVAGYMLSLGYTHANSTLKENNYNRLNIRFNTDIVISDWIGVRFDAGFSNSTRKLLDTGAPADYNNRTITSTNFLALAKSPMLSPYTYSMGAINDAHYDIDDEDYLDEISSLRNANYKMANPLAINEYGSAENKNYYDNSYVNFTVAPKWSPNKHLSFSSLFAYTLVNTNDKYYVPMNGVPSYFVAELQGTRDNEIGSLYAKQNSITSDTRIEWKNVYGGHNIDLLGGFRFLNNTFSQNTQRGYNTQNDKTPYINNATDRTTGGVSGETWTTLAYYAQAKYNYANRYYLQGDLSVETNSQFGRDAKGGLKMGGVVWGIFPSLQAGWVLTNERWFDVAGIDYLKFNTGFGLSGNDDLIYDASRTYFASQLFLSKIPSLTLANIGNTELKWETTKRFNVGMEGRFFNNRIGFDVNYFHSWTDNLLTLRELSFLSGLDLSWSNGGSLVNDGFDAHFSAHVISGNKWNWSLGASIGHYMNRLTALPDGQDKVDYNVLGGLVRSQVGHAVNTFYGLKTDKTQNGTIVYATSSEAKADGLYFTDETNTKHYYAAGDVKYLDVDSNKEINKDDYVAIGNANPDIYGNIWSSLTYKNLTLDVNFTYSLGNDIYNYNRQQLESGSRFMNQTKAMLGRWSHEGQVTDIPRATYGDPMGNAAFSDRWIEDGSYLRLKYLTLSYKLPLNSEFIKGLSVWAQAVNLFTLTRYLGSNPESSMSNNLIYQGVDGGLLSSGRSFNLGVKINL